MGEVANKLSAKALVLHKILYSKLDKFWCNLGSNKNYLAGVINVVTKGKIEILLLKSEC
jgi:hypothetical protein